MTAYPLLLFQRKFTQNGSDTAPISCRSLSHRKKIYNWKRLQGTDERKRFFGRTFRNELSPSPSSCFFFSRPLRLLQTFSSSFSRSLLTLYFTHINYNTINLPIWMFIFFVLIYLPAIKLFCHVFFQALVSIDNIFNLLLLEEPKLHLILLYIY